MQEDTGLIGIIVLLVIVIWCLIGFLNYKKRMRIVYSYNELIDKLENKENDLQTIEENALTFIHRENLKVEHTILEEIRQNMIIDKKRTERSLLYSFVMLGPLYYIK